MSIHKLSTSIGFLVLAMIFSVRLQSQQKKFENSFTIYSDILQENRTCLLSVPETYDESSYKNEKYPVLILLDGAVFFTTTVGIVQFMSASRNRNYFMPETIIVAIENVDRERDFTVTKIQTKRENTMGGGKKFLAFIENELLPYIEKNYRTTQHRTLVGHSLGGLLTVNSYISNSNVFQSYVAIDPSIWWDENMTKSKVANFTTPSTQKKLYIATANQGEANKGKNKIRHEVFFTQLQQKLVHKETILLEYFENENHRSVPLPAIYNGLKFVNQ